MGQGVGWGQTHGEGTQAERGVCSTGMRQDRDTWCGWGTGAQAEAHTATGLSPQLSPLSMLSPARRCAVVWALPEAGSLLCPGSC